MKRIALVLTLSLALAGTLLADDGPFKLVKEVDLGHSVTTLVFAEKGTHLLGSEGGESKPNLRLVKIDDGSVRTIPSPSRDVTALALVGKGDRVLVGTKEKKVHIVALKDGASVFALEGHTWDVVCAGVVPGGQVAVTGAWDGTARVWDVAKGKQLLKWSGHEVIARDKSAPFINALAIAPKGNLVATAGDDHKVRVWDLKTGKESRAFGPHSARACAVGFFAGGTRVVSADMAGELRTWDLATGQQVAKLEGHKEWITGLAVLPDGKRAIVSDLRGDVVLWDLAAAKELGRKKVGNAPVYLDLAPDGKRFVTRATADKATIWALP